MRHRHSLVSVFFVALSFVCTAAAQQLTPPTFRASTRLIVEAVTVKDKDGRVVEGLTAKDFVVVEDGEPQTISFVEYQRLPDRRGDARAAGVSAAPPRPLVVPPSSAVTQGQIVA